MLDMYAIIWNEYVKDLIIAESEEQARELASDDTADVDARLPEVRCVKLDDDLQTITNYGLMTIRQVINRYCMTGIFTSVDDIRVQFDDPAPNREEQ